MKKLLGILAISALTVSAFAQGTVTFGNLTGLVKQWTSASDSTLISVPKSGGYVELIAAPKGTPLPHPSATAYSSLAAFLAANPGWGLGTAASGTPPLPSLIALGAGVWAGGTITINNITEAASADYIVLAWANGVGTTPSSWDAALAAGNGFFGTSAVFNTATGDPLATPPGTPVNLKTSFTGMTLAPVPEPSTFALAGLGIAALLALRRRN